MTNTKLVTVTILNKDYCIKCAAEETEALQQSATYLKQKTQELQKTPGDAPEKLAIVAALNICHDYLSLKKEKNQHINAITQLTKKIKNSLEISKEIAL